MSSPPPKETFARVVVTPELVRSAFTEVPAARWWWRVVLAMHGKPCRPGVSLDEIDRVVAAGFRFYGALYVFVGALFLVLSLALWSLAVASDATYWPLLGSASGGYLLLAGRVAFKGADLFHARRDRGIALLLLFLLMVATFLALFLGVASTVTNAMGLVAPGSTLPFWARWWSSG